MGPISKLSTSFPPAEACLNLLVLLHVDAVSILGAAGSNTLQAVAPTNITQHVVDRGLLDLLHYT